MKNKETIEKFKDLEYWKKNAEEDFAKAPISVLRYVSELEIYQTERSYSEEEVLEIFKQYNDEKFRKGNWAIGNFLKWFGQFKKPNTWYNEEQTNKRMNVIGQNGNDGTHYENK